MREKLGDHLPKFSDADRELVMDSVDFLGLNHYTSRYIAHATNTGGLHYYEIQEMERAGFYLWTLINLSFTLLNRFSCPFINLSYFFASNVVWHFTIWSSISSTKICFEFWIIVFSFVSLCFVQNNQKEVRWLVIRYPPLSIYSHLMEEERIFYW